MVTQTPPASRQAIARSQALDDLIMGTNSSSIVSKRSVERLYHPDEPHFFRYFVKKFQRRAPLINRGYWLRLRAIDVILRQFLSLKTPKKKVIINLGCGSDVLPWQCHARYGAVNDNVLFIDVDYPDLLRKKRAIVLETPQLRDLLGSNFAVSQSDSNRIMLQSDRYCQLACDLRELEVFRHELESLLNLTNCHILFVAEVSITYMDNQSADSLIQWASSIGQAEFCLLEQILPQGPDHPFAQTMLAHFDKLSTPPQSVGRYQSLEAQVTRFKNCGWKGVDIWDLWQVWESDMFVSEAEKLALDHVEPFDEWEEFVLFCRHYFIIHASAVDMIISTSSGEISQQPKGTHDGDPQIAITRQTVSKVLRRRFGNAMAISNVLGQHYMLHLMGLDASGRAATCDVFSLGVNSSSPPLPLQGPLPRVCFSLTDLGNLGVLLVGGRTSPTVSLSDCWLFQRGVVSSWVPMPALPVPLFRHSAIRLGGSSLVFVAGGKTGSSDISKGFYLFHAGKGWLRCRVIGPVLPEPSHGSILCNSSGPVSEPGIFRGLLAGGLNELGHFIREKYMWCIDTTNSRPMITFDKVAIDFGRKDPLSVFGAKVVEIDSTVAICGGVGADASFQGCSISCMTVFNETYQVNSTILSNVGGESIPFMIGSSVLRDGNDILVVGGGATCFSMGTYWQTGIYRIYLLDRGIRSSFGPLPEQSAQSHIDFLESQKFITINLNAAKASRSSSTSEIAIIAVRRVKMDSVEGFQEILRDAQPVIIEGLDLGHCSQKWTPQHIAERVGLDKEVIIHECYGDSEKMDFNSKNFSYVTESFGNVMERVQSGARLYLRSLSHDKPSQLPAKIDDDFPLLSADFSLPPELGWVKEHEFSSILRISGRVNMWLHYDVMANVYAQILGSKRMIVFPPRDVKHLAFAPGASSSSLDVFSALDTPSSSSSSLAGTHPYEVLLQPGDLLFIPSLWLHTATPITDMSVAVNVFFRDLDDSSYSNGRDVYGNKDLEAYEKGRQAAGRIIKSFQQLPQETGRFYIYRIANELLESIEES